MAFGCGKQLLLFDCETLSVISSQSTDKSSQMLRLAPVNETTIAAANEKYVTLFDVANNAKTINFRVNR